MMKINNFTKRIKIYFKIFILFIFIFVGWFGVSAEELTYEKIDNIYSYVKRPNETRLFYLKIYQFNGKPAYCIELGEDIVDNNYYSTTDYSKMGYSKEQIDYINLISYYGYEYFGHSNDYKYYMAAQELIWEYLEGIDIYWTNELSKDNPSKINIDKYLNEVKSLVNMHFVKPSINNNYEYYVGDNIEIIDNNNKLSSYEIVTEDGIGAVIKDNKIIISNNGDKVGKYKIKLRQKVVSSNSGLIYFNDTSQTLYSMRGIKPNELEFDIEIKGATFILNKYDSKTLTNVTSNGGILSGAEYGLYDNNDELISVLVTDDKGQASIDGLIFGSYKIKEITSSYGYKLDNNIYEVVIDGISNELIVYEEPDLKLIEIYKTYGDIFLPEMNVSFDILKEDGELFSTITTDERGYASVFVPYGNYIIIQNNTVDGYLKVDDFQVNVDENSDDVLTFTLNDEKIEEPIEEPEVEEIAIVNPKTYDGIINNIILFSISLLILLGIVIYGINEIFYKINFKLLKKLVLLLVVFIGGVEVKADNTLYVTSYMFQDHWGIANNGVNNLFFNANIYNGYFYSLDVGQRLTDKIYYMTDNYLSLGYSDEQIEYINKLSYYGYHYQGHQDNFYYFLATQELIWEYLSDYDVYWTDQFSNFGREVDISSYKDEILELILNNDVLPSFNLSTYNYSVFDDIEIEDINNVLNDYEIIDSDGLDAKIIDNKLVIDNNKGIGEYTIRLEKNSYLDGKASIFYNNSSLKLFAPGTIDFDEVSVTLKISGSSLVVKKYDSITNSNKSLGNAVLKGASYELYDSDNKLVSTLNIDDDGSAFVDNLLEETYTLKEIISSYGYEKDSEVYTIDIDSAYNEFIIYADPILKKLEIYKTYGDRLLPDVGCIFEIYDSNGSLYTTITIDDNGYGSAFIPYGKYLVSQRSFKEGYRGLGDFELVINEDSSDVVTYSFNDKNIENFEEELKIEQVIINPKTYDGINNHIISMFVSGVLCIYILRKIWYNLEREGEIYGK